MFRLIALSRTQLQNYKLLRVKNNRKIFSREINLEMGDSANL